MKFTDYLRALDDSDLSVYEIRYLLHIWRRGSCWESLSKIAAVCQMSAGQAHKVKHGLIEKGWIVEAVDGQRIVQKIADEIPEPAADDVHVVNDSNVAIVHTMNDDVHHMNVNVHHMNALPINRTKEITTLNSNGSRADLPPVDDEREARERAKIATLALMEFWAELTGRPIPDRTRPDNVRWFKAFNAIWILCGRDTDNARGRIQAIRDDMLGRGITLFDPGKLQGHVKTAIDAELLPMTNRLNGSGKSSTPVRIEMKEIAPGLY